MPKTFTHLTQAHRDRIKALLDEGYSARKIGRTLDIPHTTVSRELKRNSYAKSAQAVRGRWSGRAGYAERAGTYDPSYAQHKVGVRRNLALHERKKLVADSALCGFVVSRLEAHWNPDEIAGYLARHQEHRGQPCEQDGCGLAYVSKTAIYRWLATTPATVHRRQLYSQRPSRKRRSSSRKSYPTIPDRQPLGMRPTEADDRQEPGHWEGDTVVSGARTGARAALAVVVERTSRLVLVRLIPDMRPASFAAAVNELLADTYIRTLSLDVSPTLRTPCWRIFYLLDGSYKRLALYITRIRIVLSLPQHMTWVSDDMLEVVS